MKTQKTTGWLAVGVALLGALPATAQTLETKTEEALVAALDDERKAQAIYGAVMAKFGQVRPFVNIIRAERNHEAQLLGLFKTYQLTVPENQYTKKPPSAPATLKDAFREGVTAEKENIVMYEGFLKFVKEPDITRVFQNLMQASKQNHLPAFQRGASR